MLDKRVYPIAILLSLALLAAPACSGSGMQDQGPADDQVASRERMPADSETVVVRPQREFVAQHTEVTLRLIIRKKELEEIRVEPKTAIIFSEPRDKKLVTQVLWRLECWIDGRLGSCPDGLIKQTVIAPKRGCSADLFGTDRFVISAKSTAIASGAAHLDPARKLYDEYAGKRKRYEEMAAAAKEKGARLSEADLPKDCDGKPLRAAPEYVDPYYGFTWLYSVTVSLGNGQKVVEDPVIWVEKDKE